jgi:hypothetical protein
MTRPCYPFRILSKGRVSERFQHDLRCHLLHSGRAEDRVRHICNRRRAKCGLKKQFVLLLWDDYSYRPERLGAIGVTTQCLSEERQFTAADGCMRQRIVVSRKSLRLLLLVPLGACLLCCRGAWPAGFSSQKNVNSRDTGADGHRERLPQRGNSFDDLVVALAFG